MEQNTTSKMNAKMVVGANTLAHFNIRCPACNKLFRIDSREIKSSSPQFDCSACKTRFTFDSPPTSPHKVQTRMVSMKETYQKLNLVPNSEASGASSALETPAELKSCPKCHAKNPGLVKECLKCGVLFGRLENLPMESSLGAIPSLVKAWQDLMSDYSNMTKHVAFVDRCDDMHALPFALKKYEMLREVQPSDKLAQKMFHQVFMRNVFRLSRRADQISWIYGSKQFLRNLSQQVNWTRVRKLAPLALGLMLIMIGLSKHSARNMAGMGAALLFLTIGLTVFIKGRISLADFW